MYELGGTNTEMCHAKEVCEKSAHFKKNRSDSVSLVSIVKFKNTKSYFELYIMLQKRERLLIVCTSHKKVLIKFIMMFFVWLTLCIVTKCYYTN